MKKNDGVGVRFSPKPIRAYHSGSHRAFRRSGGGAGRGGVGVGGREVWSDYYIVFAPLAFYTFFPRFACSANGKIATIIVGAPLAFYTCFARFASSGRDAVPAAPPSCARTRFFIRTCCAIARAPRKRNLQARGPRDRGAASGLSERGFARSESGKICIIHILGAPLAFSTFFARPPASLRKWGGFAARSRGRGGRTRDRGAASGLSLGNFS